MSKSSKSLLLRFPLPGKKFPSVNILIPPTRALLAPGFPHLVTNSPPSPLSKISDSPPPGLYSPLPLNAIWKTQMCIGVSNPSKTLPPLPCQAPFNLQTVLVPPFQLLPLYILVFCEPP